MKKQIKPILIKGNQEMKVKRISRAVLGATPPGKTIEPKTERQRKHKKLSLSRKYKMNID